MVPNGELLHTLKVVPLAVGLMLAPAMAHAQRVAGSFAELAPLVRAGDTLWVKDSSGTDVKGQLVELSPVSLALLVKGHRREWRAEEVTRIKRARQTRPNPVSKGTLEVAQSCDHVSCLPGALMLVGAAAMSEGIGALIQQPKTIYRAPKRTSSGETH